VLGKAVKLLAQLVQPGLVGKNKDRRESRWEGKAVPGDVFEKVTDCTKVGCKSSENCTLGQTATIG
jgi:hypothetical protein